jgi:hypothetical protein
VWQAADAVAEMDELGASEIHSQAESEARALAEAPHLEELQVAWQHLESRRMIPECWDDD